jgi:hypothetical protein
MNACGSFYSMVWLINLKDNNQYYAYKQFDGVPRDVSLDEK